MANSLKLSELTKVQDTKDTDLYLISRDSNELSSYSIQYNTITADLYSKIYEPLNAKIESLRTWFVSLLSGEPSLEKISSDEDGIVTNTPRKMVGVSAIYDLAKVVQNWKPLWQ